MNPFKVKAASRSSALVSLGQTFALGTFRPATTVERAFADDVGRLRKEQAFSVVQVEGAVLGVKFRDSQVEFMEMLSDWHN